MRQTILVERVLGTVSGLLAVLTLLRGDWIETVFHVDPDGGSGSVEWAIVVGLAVLSVTCFVLARRGSRLREPTGVSR